MAKKTKIETLTEALNRLADSIEYGHLLSTISLPAFFDVVAKKIKELELIIDTQIPALEKDVSELKTEICCRDMHIDHLNEKIDAYELTLELIRETRNLQN